MDLYEKDVPVGLNMLEHMDEYFANEDTYTEEEKQQKLDQVYNDYSSAQQRKAKNSKLMAEFKIKFGIVGIEQYMETNLVSMFAEEQDGLGAILKAKFDVFKEIRQSIPPVESHGSKIFVVPDELADKYHKAEAEFSDAYLAVAAIQLKRFFDRSYERDPSVKFVNFDNVMMDVVRQNIGSIWEGIKFLGRLGSKAASVGMALVK